MRTDIMRFRGKYAFLGNFYKSPIKHKGKLWYTAEHLYQAAKTDNVRDQKRIRQAKRPDTAKAFGRLVVVRSDWLKIRDRIMREIVEKKFRQNPELAKRLLATGGMWLCEGNDWGDTYWGIDVNSGEGLNKLGMILMDVREMLCAESKRKKRILRRL